MVATHPRQMRPGARSRVDDHLPPNNALAYAMRDPQGCLKQAEDVGMHCKALIEPLFADRVLDNLRAAQGVIRLKDKSGALRLEAACNRALAFDNPRYRSVKTILEKGLDQHSDQAAPFHTLAESSTGAARFLRDTKKPLAH